MEPSANAFRIYRQTVAKPAIVEDEMENKQLEDILLDVTCPACNMRTPVKIKYGQDAYNFTDFTGTQKEMPGYAFGGTEFCSCERLLRVSLSVMIRDSKTKDD